MQEPNDPKKETKKNKTTRSNQRYQLFPNHRVSNCDTCPSFFFETLSPICLSSTHFNSVFILPSTADQRGRRGLPILTPSPSSQPRSKSTSSPPQSTRTDAENADRQQLIDELNPFNGLAQLERNDNDKQPSSRFDTSHSKRDEVHNSAAQSPLCSEHGSVSSAGSRGNNEQHQHKQQQQHQQHQRTASSHSDAILDTARARAHREDDGTLRRRSNVQLQRQGQTSEDVAQTIQRWLHDTAQGRHLLNLSEVQEEDHQDRVAETFVIAALYNAKQAAKATKISRVQGRNIYEQAQPYSRIYFFVDIKIGEVFCILCPTYNDAINKMKTAENEGGAIGSLFLLFEPDVDIPCRYIHDCLILDTPLPLTVVPDNITLPILNNTSWGGNTYREPADDSTSVNILDGKKIEITSLHMIPASCPGKGTCDACDQPSDKKNCSCLNSPRKTSLVADCTIKVMDPDGTVLFRTKHYTSRRFTDLYVKGSYAASKAQDFEANRADVINSYTILTEYINNHGGWTVGTWAMRGQKKDENAPDKNATILSDIVKPHIFLLRPTRPYKDIDIMKYQLPEPPLVNNTPIL